MTSKMLEARIESIVALGGNLPRRRETAAVTLRQAIGELGQQGATIRSVSRFYSSPSVPAGAGPDYVNAAITVSSKLDAAGLLDLLHEVERRFDRERETRWGARTLDLDLIDHDGRVRPDADSQRSWMNLAPALWHKQAPGELILPHPRLQDRPFVLLPLLDIRPDWVHPVLNLSVRQMLNAHAQSEIDAVRPV